MLLTSTVSSTAPRFRAVCISLWPGSRGKHISLCFDEDCCPGPRLVSVHPLSTVINTKTCRRSIRRNWKSSTPWERLQVSGSYTALEYLIITCCSLAEHCTSAFSDILSVQSWPANMSDLSVFSNLQIIEGRTLYKWVLFPLPCSCFDSLVDYASAIVWLSLHVPWCKSDHFGICISFFPL